MSEVHTKLRRLMERDGIALRAVVGTLSLWSDFPCDIVQEFGGSLCSHNLRGMECVEFGCHRSTVVEW